MATVTLSFVVALVLQHQCIYLPDVARFTNWPDKGPESYLTYCDIEKLLILTALVALSAG